MQSVSLNDRVKRIKNNQEEINRLVEEYKPFIASCTEKATGRYMRYGEDDELSIALLAFVEAINSYNVLKGNFLSFAHNVIKRRIIDHYRKEKKHAAVVSLNDYRLDEGEEELDLSTGESVERFKSAEINDLRRMELKRELDKWEISFSELAEASPKQEKTRRLYRQMTSFVLSTPELVDRMLNKKYLPIIEIEKGTGIPRKKIERARKYIIAVVIIISGDYQSIREYVDWR